MSGFGGLLTGHTLVGRYRIDSVIGRGGFAVVYEAEDERLQRAVAVKVITLSGPEGSLEEEVRARFQREARASAALQHPNVVGIFDFGTDPALGLDFLVMERLRGEDLRTRLRRPDPMSYAEAMHILRSAAAGVGAGHEAGIIHRDVKPANIFLSDSRPGEQVTVRVLDFGIALLAAADDTTRLTRNGVVLSVPYASPEQLDGEAELVPASDVFALGAVAYETLARRRPFSGNASRAHQERLGPVTPLEELNPEVPPQVAAAVHRALSRDPADRFPDAHAFARALEGEGTEAGPRRSAPAVVAAPAPPARPVAAPGLPVGLPGNDAPASPVRPRPTPGSRSRAPLLAGAAVLAVALIGGALVLGGDDEPEDAPLAARPAAVADARPATTDSAVADSVVAPATEAEPAPSRPEAEPPPPTPAPAAGAARTPAAASGGTTTPRREPAKEPATAGPAPARPAPRPAAPANASRSAGAEFRENLSHPCHSRPTATAQGACLRADLAEADRELNAVYQRAMARLPADRRQALRVSQRAWLVRYDRVITSYYSTPWGDHSRIRVLPSQIQALRDRTDYLRSLESGGG